MERVFHEFGPFYNCDSKILILGSFPSVKSREVNFYYGHPQNRFWKVLASIFEDELPITIEDKKAFLTKHHIALWDSIASCVIQGSSDASIQNVEVNNIQEIIEKTKIQTIVLNGKAASKYFVKPAIFDGEIYVLPSTSAANASYTLDKLIEKWKVIQ